MENIQLIVFTSLLIILFTAFLIGTLLEFKNMSNTTKYIPDEKTGIADKFLALLAKLFPGETH